MPDILNEVLKKVNQLIDPETSRTLGDVNLVAEIRMLEDGAVKIVFTPNSPYSPTAVNVGLSIRNAAQSVDGVKKVIVECSGHMMDGLVNTLVNKA